MERDFIRIEDIEDHEVLKDCCRSKFWRMNNLYWIQDKQGQRVRFRMNSAQQYLHENTHGLDIVLKARQLGFSTYIQLHILDECIFVDGTEAGVIAHTKDDAMEIFRRKIKFPYDNLPKGIKKLVPLITDSKSQLELGNGSIITVGVSMRSGTLQLLHISEYGKVCATRPDKALEVLTGSLQTVAVGQKIWIESTAEGRSGYFFDMCQEAQRLKEQGVELTELDFKFHFFPWFEDSAYQLPVSSVVWTTEDMEYFETLERLHDIVLTKQQQAWYIKKKVLLQDKMKQEYPSTPAEAFEAATIGAYYSKEFSKARTERRIGHVPHDPAMSVHSSWDLGYNDTTAIWLFQHYGNQFRLINYYENNGEALAHYVNWLSEQRDKLGYQYGFHHFPHDVKVTELGSGKTRKHTLRKLGIRDMIVVPRDRRIEEGIEATRQVIAQCWFDEAKCDQGIKALEAYQKDWDDRNGVYRKQPLHNWASNGADAFRMMARGFRNSSESMATASAMMDHPNQRRNNMQNFQPQYEEAY